jgi:hypothetical protein
MKIVPDYMRQKPYLKEWHKGVTEGIFTVASGKSYHLNRDRWDLIGSIRKNGKTFGQLSFVIAPKAYDAYNATLKYIQESGLLENHTFEEAYDIVCFLVEMVCRASERYIAEHSLGKTTYRGGWKPYAPSEAKTVCNKLIPGGKKLYPIVKAAMDMRFTLAGYRFNEGWFPKGWRGCGVKNMKRFQIRKNRGYV